GCGAMSAELLSVRDLSVSFTTEAGVARVLDAVSLSLAPGEIMGLVGESGCGNTTGGRLTFDNHDLLAASEQLRGRAITFVPQDPFSSFSPLFTVGDQVM